MKLVSFTNEKNRINDFINFVNDIYTENENTQNDKEVEKLLTDRHPFSEYFHLKKYLLYNNDKVVARFIFTIYPEDENLYLGFFECLDNDKIATFLFKQIDVLAKSLGFNKIIGPVDASFWLKYRLKVNKFDENPYTGEPYNKDYYLRLFLNNGYHIKERYSSSRYKTVDKSFNNEKFNSRYQDKLKAGYKIVSPDMKNWDKVIEEIYYLISDLYKNFPVYKPIRLDTFKNYFSLYKKIINPKMVKMAYFDNKAIGFYISVPNYNNLVYRLHFINFLKIIWLKFKPESYVMLYMGVDKQHQGLGKALIQSIINELKISGLVSIGALQKEGKITRGYIKELIEDRYEYVLLGKDIDNV